MFGGLLNILYADFPGGAADLNFLYAEDWLADSAVNTLIVQKQGRWHISLVMAWAKNPLRLICRNISECATQQKAEQYAEAYLRTAQKDRRGSLKINYEDFNTCPN